MLNRTSIPAPFPRMTWGVLRQGLSAGPNALLLQLMLIFVAASVLACVYLWQSSIVSAIQKDTARIQAESADLERENVALMLQLAQWDSPAHIEQKAREQGLLPGQKPLVMQVPPTPPEDAAASSGGTDLSMLWREMLAYVPVSSAITR